jgi:hypothetical protein
MTRSRNWRPPTGSATTMLGFTPITSHIDQVILLNQAGKNSHEHICESLELFAREVMPEFRLDPEHDAWKAGVMSGAIQLKEIDTDAFTDRYGKLALNVAAPKPAPTAAE